MSLSLINLIVSYTPTYKHYFEKEEKKLQTDKFCTDNKL